MKKILGLDLGTNSIGWAVVNANEDGTPTTIEGMGSRIIPMGADKISYEKGAGITKNADRRAKRTARKGNKRYKQRRDKLLFVLNELGMLPEQFIVRHKVRDEKGKLTDEYADGFPDSNHLQDLVLEPIKKNSLQLTSKTYYEKRVNAIHNKVDNLSDLGKILYQFNQLRGYAGGNRNDEKNKKAENVEDEENKKYEVFTAKCLITDIEKSDYIFKVKGGINKGQELPKYIVTLISDDKEYRGETELQTLEKDKDEELEIRIKRTKKGETITFALPQKTNWRKQMEKTEETLNERNKYKHYYIGELLLDDLKENQWTKIRNRVILRKRYQEEFDAIWETQSQYFDVLKLCSKESLQRITNYLYPGNGENQIKLRNEAIEKGLYHIIRNQIIYYQRPLKPQTDLIANCQFEKDEKVTPESNPIFQEFRCWQQINNLYVTSKQKVFDERKKKEVYKYKDRYLTDEQREALYDKLQIQKQLGFGEVAKIVQLKDDKTEYLNGLNVKAKLKGCDTNISIRKILGAYAEELENKNTNIISEIWNILYYKTGNEYDVDSDNVKSLINTLCQYVDKQIATELSLNLAQKISFTKKYKSLSVKAINNILPLMKSGKYYSNEKLSAASIDKYNKIVNTINTGEIDDSTELYMVDYLYNNSDLIEKGGMMYAFATSLVYGSHSNTKIKPSITNYHDIVYTERNLRNPIVEQITNETMQIIKAIWKQYKFNPQELEIRVELARELKNSAVERERIYKSQIKNKKINDSIKQRLIELNQEASSTNIDKYKLWSKQSTEDYPKFKDIKSPTQDEIQRLRIWEEQKCVSPYTNKPIPLSKLFDTREYDIDHIIPKARFFDDSMANKVICESNINEEKSNRTAWEYITQQTSKHKIFDVEAYIKHVNDNFFGQKKKNLLLEKIPTDCVTRQIKDTQYISVAVKSELAKIVGSDNVKSSTGEITSFLRSHWGLKKLFMELTESRFKQMELWDKTKEWVKRYYDKDKGKNVYEIENWSKRYDHRHHSIDALVVAMTTQKHIQALNNLNKEMQDWLNENKDAIKLDVAEGESLIEAFFNLDEKRREEIQKEMPSFRKFDAPMNNLVDEAKKILETMIVSQKPKNALSVQYSDKTKKKELRIRGALHEETYYGKHKGQDTKIVDISNLSAKDIDKILDVTKGGLKDEINAHRNKKDENGKEKYNSMKEAFSGEGLIDFNETRKLNGKPPVYKIKLRYNTKEKKESGLQVLYDEHKGKNQKLSVVTGNNYLFVVMEKTNKKGETERCFDIVSLFDAAKYAKNNMDGNFIDDITSVVCKENKANKVLFTLQQNDLVYCPESVDDSILRMTNEELKKCLENDDNKKAFVSRIYKVVKFTGKDCFFIPNNYANSISVQKKLSEEEKDFLKKEKYKDKTIPKTELFIEEFGSFGNCVKTIPNADFVKRLKAKANVEDKIIKIQDICVKLNIDWLGNVSIIKM